MKAKPASKRQLKLNEPLKTLPETAEAAEPTTASGRWTSIQRIRLPHKPGLPLSSGGGGDSVSR